MARTAKARVGLVLLIVAIELVLLASARPSNSDSRNRFYEDRIKTWTTRQALKADCSIPGVCSGPLKVYYASTDCSGMAMSYGCFQDPGVCYPEVAPDSAYGSKMTCDENKGLIQQYWSNAACEGEFDRSKTNPINTCIRDGAYQSYMFVCSCDDIGDGANTPGDYEPCPSAEPYETNCPVFGTCPPTNYWMTSFNDSACTKPMYSYATVPPLPLDSCYATTDIVTNRRSVNHITKCGDDGYIYDNYYLGSAGNPYLFETKATKIGACLQFNWGYEIHYCKP